MKKCQILINKLCLFEFGSSFKTWIDKTDGRFFIINKNVKYNEEFVEDSSAFYHSLVLHINVLLVMNFRFFSCILIEDKLLKLCFIVTFWLEKCFS